MHFGSARSKTNYQDIDKELVQHISKWIRFCFMKVNVLFTRGSFNKKIALTTLLQTTNFS